LTDVTGCLSGTGQKSSLFTDNVDPGSSGKPSRNIEQKQHRGGSDQSGTALADTRAQAQKTKPLICLSSLVVRGGTDAQSEDEWLDAGGIRAT